MLMIMLVFIFGIDFMLYEIENYIKLVINSIPCLPFYLVKYNGGTKFVFSLSLVLIKPKANIIDDGNHPTVDQRS